jgi:uncharacterized membrane protein YjjP (DUF1212 family)
VNGAIGDIMEVCLLAGKIMLQSGGETYRVEDTMNRIARACAVAESHSYVTPTGIFLSIQGNEREKEQTKFMRINERLIDLNKITQVNDISRKMGSNQLTINEAYLQLKTIENSQPLYPVWLQILSAASASGFSSLMFGGISNDFLSSVLISGIGFFFFLRMSEWVRVKFFAEIFAAFLIGTIAYIFFSFGINIHIDTVIISSVMPLVPGLLITNAVRDLMAGDLVSGLARGAEAFFTAFAIGAGVAVTLALSATFLPL